LTIKKCPECYRDISTRAKACPHCGARSSLTSNVALWAGRIVLICIAGVVSILSGLSLVMRFFGGQLKRPVLRAPKVGHDVTVPFDRQPSTFGLVYNC